MAYNTMRPVADKYLFADIIDASTASIAHIAVPAQGRVVGAYASLSAAITTANSIITIKKGSTAIGTLTLAYSGSAVGSVFTASMTGSEANCTFAAGDAIVLDNDGASDTTSIVRVTVVYREL